MVLAVPQSLGHQEKVTLQQPVVVIDRDSFCFLSINPGKRKDKVPDRSVRNDRLSNDIRR